MIRVIYLLEQPRSVRTQLVTSSVSGERWRIATTNGKTKVVSDRDMVDHAERLHGWTRNVYDFGCRFIHLSNAHDHRARDPFQALPLEDRQVIANHLNKYHGDIGDAVSSDSTFDHVAAYVPHVLKKISSNLEFEVAPLQAS